MSVTPFRHTSGLEGFKLVATSGWSIEILNYGAQVISWKNPEGEELLFMSENAVLEPGRAIRGGVPIIFPQFGSGPGGTGKLPSHGIARTTAWKLTFKSSDLICYKFPEEHPAQGIWPFKHRIELEVSLDVVLKMRLLVVNTGDTPFNVQTAFHNYFRVSDISKVRLQGLEGKRYIDFLAAENEGNEQRADTIVDGPTDRVFKSTSDILIYDDGTGKRIRLSKEGGAVTDTVLWNPWKEGNEKLKDLHPEGYRQMICVESGNIVTPVTLQPSESFSGWQKFDARS